MSSRQQQVLRAVLDAGGWISTADVAANADIESGITAAFLAHLRNKGFITSERIDGASNGALRHRVSNNEAAEAYLAGETSPAERPRNAKPEKAKLNTSSGVAQQDTIATTERKAGHSAAKPSAKATPKPAVEPTELPQPGRVDVTWAIDHRGKLILCFGDAAFELQPPQWKPLARFLRQLEPEFAGNPNTG